MADSREATAEELADALLEELRAERTLADMESFQEVADLWQDETCPVLRKEFAESYRRIIGIHPRDIARLKTALGSGQPVSKAIAQLNGESSGSAEV